MKHSCFDTVLFDLDGTLMYTLPDIHLSLNHILSLHGYPLRTIEETRSFIGGGVRRLLERALPEGAPDMDELCREYTEYYGTHAQDHVDFYPGIQELVAALRSHGIRTGVVTNKPHAAAVRMIGSFCGENMDVTIGKKENTPAKPDPECLLDAMEILHASESNTLYIGDAPVDAETAKNAGIACMLVSWGYTDRPVLENCESLGVFDSPDAMLHSILAESVAENNKETAHAV